MQPVNMAEYILKQIKDPVRRNATTPTRSMLGALQQNWSLNMAEYT